MRVKPLTLGKTGNSQGIAHQAGPDVVGKGAANRVCHHKDNKKIQKSQVFGEKQFPRNWHLTPDGGASLDAGALASEIGCPVQAIPVELPAAGAVMR